MINHGSGSLLYKEGRHATKNNTAGHRKSDLLILFLPVVTESFNALNRQDKNANSKQESQDPKVPKVKGCLSRSSSNLVYSSLHASGIRVEILEPPST